MLLYGAFDPWYYGVLDDTPGTIHTQAGSATLALTPSATQIAPAEVYDHAPDISLGLYSETTVVHATPPVRYHTGSAAVAITPAATQIHAPAHAQTGTPTLVITAAAAHAHSMPASQPRPPVVQYVAREVSNTATPAGAVVMSSPGAAVAGSVVTSAPAVVTVNLTRPTVSVRDVVRSSQS